MEFKKRLRYLLGRVYHYRLQHREVQENIEKKIGSLEVSGYTKYYFYFDTLRAKILYGINEDDYFCSEFYRKSRYARKESFMTYDRFPFRKSLQYPEGRAIFCDKEKMYKSYAEFLNRDYMILDANTDINAFKSFISHNSSFITKPFDGYGGNGVKKYKDVRPEDAVSIYNELIVEENSKVVVEEIICQIDELAKFNPESVNTIRIITLILDNGDIIIPMALFRIGNGSKCVDNFSSGGICCNINIKHGVVESAVDRKNRKYIYHPETKLKLIGFEIPDWDKYIEFAKTVAAKDKKMRYMGWDIVKNKDGQMCLIEGNEDAGFDYQEMAIGNKGLGFFYKALISGDKKFNLDEFIY